MRSTIYRVIAAMTACLFLAACTAPAYVNVSPEYFRAADADSVEEANSAIIASVQLSDGTKIEFDDYGGRYDSNTDRITGYEKRGPVLQIKMAYVNWLVIESGTESSMPWKAIAITLGVLVVVAIVGIALLSYFGYWAH